MIGTQEAIKQPDPAPARRERRKSKYHQIFYDQALGPSVGAVVNDVSADLAAGRMKPTEAAEAVQQAWELAQ